MVHRSVFLAAFVPALVLVSGCDRGRDTPSREVRTTSAELPRTTPSASASVGAPPTWTEWTDQGPRTRTREDLNDMGMHHPPAEPRDPPR